MNAEILSKHGLPFRRVNSTVIRNNINGWLFISPWVIGFLLLTAYPLVSSLYYSFTNYTVIKPPEWVGLSNYIELFTRDPLFWTAIRNSLFFVALYVPLSIVLGVGVAMLLNLPVRGKAIYRTLVFLPSIVPEIVTGLLWIWIFHPQFGAINNLLKLGGMSGPGWLSDPMWSKPALVIISLWGLGSSVVIYLAALQDVPEQLYEAAAIDGAGPLANMRHITLPMITPTILFNLVLGIISGLQTFTSAFIITKGTGGPVDSTLFYGLLIYRNAFSYLKMGYASAMSWILFLVILTITLIVFKTSGRWVFYGGDAK
jgi:multiple sugar transport system permease protein